MSCVASVIQLAGYVYHSLCVYGHNIRHEDGTVKFWDITSSELYVHGDITSLFNICSSPIILYDKHSK